MVKRTLNELEQSGSKKRQLDEVKQVRAVQNSQTQNSLSKFFGTPPAKKRGQADLAEFPENFTIYSWNVNGISAGIQKGSFTDFISNHTPTILCLNETKIDEIKLE